MLKLYILFPLYKAGNWHQNSDNMRNMFTRSDGKIGIFNFKL